MKKIPAEKYLSFRDIREHKTEMPLESRNEKRFLLGLFCNIAFRFHTVSRDFLTNSVWFSL